MKTLPAVLALLLAATLAHAAPPVVTNIRPAQLAGTKNVEILYDVSDADGDALTIGMQVSGDAGQTYTIPATALSGHIGAGVAPGVNRRIVWNAGADWNGQLVSSAKVRVTASDGTTPAPPPGMVYIPAGVFQMGDNFYEGSTNALPVHNVILNAFFMDRTEVPKELWIAVRTWGAGNGYSINAGSYKADGHPVQSANWSANGYRLPTEAEWEKGSRGGAIGLRYPWGDAVDGSQANYSGSGDVSEGQSPATTPVGYYNGSQTPVGVDMANGYGLYDMAGNVREWCWDWYGGTYYGDASANNNPHGPTTGSYRALRGGNWNDSPSELRCALRIGPSFPSPAQGSTLIGFRCVRGM